MNNRRVSIGMCSPSSSKCRQPLHKSKALIITIYTALIFLQPRPHHRRIPRLWMIVHRYPISRSGRRPRTGRCPPSAQLRAVNTTNPISITNTYPPLKRKPSPIGRAKIYSQTITSTLTRYLPTPTPTPPFTRTTPTHPSSPAIYPPIQPSTPHLQPSAPPMDPPTSPIHPTPSIHPIP